TTEQCIPLLVWALQSRCCVLYSLAVACAAPSLLRPIRERPASGRGRGEHERLVSAREPERNDHLPGVVAREAIPVVLADPHHHALILERLPRADDQAQDSILPRIDAG